ncbi:lipid transferase CIDEA [Polymixia lowei]
MAPSILTVLPESLMRSVSSVQTTISKYLLPSSQRCCLQVYTPSRRRSSCLVASSLDELLDQAARVFLLSCQFLTLVLEEDGTVVDSEAFFQALPKNTAVMVLGEGERWTQSKLSPNFRQRRRTGIAKVTFDLYKLHPEEFLGCLTVEASLYEMYSLSYDIRCPKARHILKSALRCLTSVTRLAGQSLLYASSSVLQVIGEDDC